MKKERLLNTIAKKKLLHDITDLTLTKNIIFKIIECKRMLWSITNYKIQKKKKFYKQRQIHLINNHKYHINKTYTKLKKTTIIERKAKTK